jgi:hypothetical protein
MEHLSTPQLKVGDVVSSYGIRVRIDGPARVYHGGCDYRDNNLDGYVPVPGHEPKCRVVYAWPSTVLNLDEVLANRIAPRSFFFDTERDHKGPGHGREDYWTIQGNDLATWSVAR